MSSELMIHQGAKRLTGRVNTLDGSEYTVVGLTFLNDGDDYTGSAERITLYLENDRLLEAVLVFRKLAQELAALLPDVDPSPCPCLPREPDDQCPRHGFGAYKSNHGYCSCGYPPSCECSSDCPCYQAGTEAERRPLSY